MGLFDFFKKNKKTEENPKSVAPQKPTTEQPKAQPEVKREQIIKKVDPRRSSLKDEAIRNACDSDIFAKIAEVVNGNEDALDKAVKYLDEKGNLSMKLRVMTLGDPQAVMIALMTLEPSDANNLNRLCNDGLNPALHFSMYKGMEVLIRVIAHANANLDVVGIKGHTPLTIACENGLSETVKMLINNGARAVDKCDDSGFAPLHYACQLGNPEMVNALIKAGANVNVLSADKLMPIHLAISTVQASQMSPTTPNGIPWSPREAFTCVQLLANNGADLNYVCPYGFSGFSFLKMIGAVKEC